MFYGGGILAQRAFNRRRLYFGVIEKDGVKMSGKVIHSEKAAKLYTLARRAVDAGDIDKIQQYYEAILLEEPNSWEAIMYTECNADGRYRDTAHWITRTRNAIPNVVRLMKEQETDYKAALRKIVNHCDYITGVLCHGADAYYEQLRSKTNSNTPIDYFAKIQDSHAANYGNASGIMYVLGDAIEDNFPEDAYLDDYAVPAWKSGVERRAKGVNFFSEKEDKEHARDVIMSYVEAIQKRDPNYKTPEIKISGCYVATAVYGSYDCPEVWTLRRFRDDILAESAAGRLFIHCYYAVSPTLVKWFGKTEWFRKLWRGQLDALVKKLQEDGVQNTPYNDKNW